MGAKHHIRDGRSTRFWVDWWQGSGPLCTRFPSLFAIALEPSCSVALMVQDEEWRIPLRRQLGPVERCEWDDLLRQLGPPIISGGADSLEWMLTPSRKFSVKSLYLKLCQGLPQKHFCQIWGIGVPLKIRIFLWQLARKRLPSNDNIARRKGPSTGRCGLCGDPEDTNRIFFDCSLAKFLWSAVRELLHCSWNPSCFADLFRLL